MSYNINRSELFEPCYLESNKNQVESHIVNLKSSVGKGNLKIIPILEGLNLYKIDIDIYKDLKVHGGFEGDYLMFSSIFEGSVNYEDEILKERFNFKKGETNLSYCKYEKGIEYYKEGQSFKFVTLFCDKNFVSKHKLINKIFNKNLKKDHFRFNSLNPYSHMVTNEIFNNPYEGTFENFFLENKAMDLIFYGLNEYQNQNKQVVKNNFLNEEDIIRIKRAREILLKDYVNPPSISQLSKLVAVNEFKLKKGFKLVYDETIYGYLLDYKMKKAHALLEENIYSIKEVAHKVGYKCQSSFTVAFVKKFGVLPKEIIKTKNYYY